MYVTPRLYTNLRVLEKLASRHQATLQTSLQDGYAIPFVCGNNSMDNEEAKPFIVLREGGCPELHRRDLNSRPTKRKSIAVFLQIALILVYTIISVVVIRTSSKECSRPSQGEQTRSGQNLVWGFCGILWDSGWRDDDY